MVLSAQCYWSHSSALNSPRAFLSNKTQPLHILKNSLYSIYSLFFLLRLITVFHTHLILPFSPHVSSQLLFPRNCPNSFLFHIQSQFNFCWNLTRPPRLLFQVLRSSGFLNLELFGVYTEIGAHTVSYTTFPVELDQSPEIKHIHLYAIKHK